ncbi:MAG: DUF2795 domain-containing protein [Vulcanimicrobiaceae bacterium]
MQRDDNIETPQATDDQLVQTLRGVVYPATRDDLATYAEERGVSTEMQARIANLPSQQFENEAQVRAAWAQMTPDTQRSDEATH